MARRRTNQTKRDYPRTARLGELLREIVAEELTELGDERLELFTITAVEVDNDLNRAVVYFDTLDGADADPDVLAALTEHRGRLKLAIGRQARVRKVPDLSFRPDPAVRAGEHIEGVLRDMGPGVDVPVPDVYVAGSGIEPTSPAAGVEVPDPAAPTAPADAPADASAAPADTSPPAAPTAPA